mgnify:CR=1 FL=1
MVGAEETQRGCATLTLNFFFQEEDGLRVLVRSRGLGDENKRQHFGDGYFGVFSNRRMLALGVVGGGRDGVM